jgi:hypothetical protein
MHLRMPLQLLPALMIFTTVFPLQLRIKFVTKTFGMLAKQEKVCAHLWFMNLALLPFIVPSTCVHDVECYTKNC